MKTPNPYEPPQKDPSGQPRSLALRVHLFGLMVAGCSLFLLYTMHIKIEPGHFHFLKHTFITALTAMVMASMLTLSGVYVWLVLRQYRTPQGLYYAVPCLGLLGYVIARWVIG